MCVCVRVCVCVCVCVCVSRYGLNPWKLNADWRAENSTASADGILEGLYLELKRLFAAVATVKRWGLEVPSELISVDRDALRTMPLAATDPVTAGCEVGVTVQRVIGAMVVNGGPAALKHVAWVGYDDDGVPVFEDHDMGGWAVSRPVLDDATKRPQLCDALDDALAIYAERATATTADLVPMVLGDVAAYTQAKSAALAAAGAGKALATLTELIKQVPQPCGLPSGNDDGGHSGEGNDNAALPVSGMARGKALVRLGDPTAPSATALEHAVHKQLRAAAGSKRLYTLISEVARRAGSDLVVLPGGVKKLPRTVFKCAVDYGCDLSEIIDMVRCTVVADSLAEVTATVREMLASTDLSVVRVKNRFAVDYDAFPAGGYLDLQAIVVFESAAGEWTLGEVQVNLWSMLRIKESPNGGHKIFNFARSLRAYDEATYRFKGAIDTDSSSRIAAGALLVVDLRRGGCKTEPDQIELGRALSSDKCRVVQLNLASNVIGAPGATALASALKTNATITTIDLNQNETGDAGVAALAEALKTNTTVTAINLVKNDIGDAGAVALADALESNKAISMIMLSENKIGDAGAVALAEALQVNTAVTTMGLGDNSIETSGAVALAQALLANTTLTTLGLGDNNVEDTGAIALANALKTNTVVVASSCLAPRLVKLVLWHSPTRSRPTPPSPKST